MSYLLNSTAIKAPNEMSEQNSTQMAENRTLEGSIVRDHFGDNKRTWILQYRNTGKSDYDTIKAIYDSYLADSQTKTFEVTESNYTIASTNVHIDLMSRQFRVGGEDYISDFTLVLTEA